jgi:hypothetical protein
MTYWSANFFRAVSTAAFRVSTSGVGFLIALMSVIFLLLLLHCRAWLFHRDISLTITFPQTPQEEDGLLLNVPLLTNVNPVSRSTSSMKLLFFGFV